jgi:BirA family biotin operon repressor/biotin-[acetyl-CoA-carboxylase] ligase
MDKKALNNLPDGFDHQAFLSIDSTNKEAIRRLHQGDASGLWITASEQTLGRGRSGRDWESKPGNLFCSLIQKTDGDIRKSSQLSFVAALAVHNTITEFIDPDRVKCKWPNDILVVGRKISGILLESYVSDNGTNYMIIGIGVNVAHHPEKTLYETTHINAETDQVLSHIDVFFVLTHKMSGWIEAWQSKGFEYIRKNWLSVATGLGSKISVRLPNEQFEGRFIDLDSSGALKLETDNEIKLIHSGDVFFA